MNNGSFNQDSELVTAIQNGGSAADRAIEVLYRRYRNEVLTKVKTMIRFRKGQQEDAKDLVQDAYLVLLDKIRSEDYQQGSLKNFWVGIVYGLFRNKNKRDHRTTLVDENSVLDGEDLNTPEVSLETKERMELFENLLNQIGDRCKKVMKLSIAGYSMKEIATQMDLVSEGMARKIKYTCKKKLVELVQKMNLDI
jgi:RNA polymerase sigma factor (sigma-70 family)